MNKKLSVNDNKTQIYRNMWYTLIWKRNCLIYTNNYKTNNEDYTNLYSLYLQNVFMGFQCINIIINTYFTHSYGMSMSYSTLCEV